MRVRVDFTKVTVSGLLVVALAACGTGAEVTESGHRTTTSADAPDEKTEGGNVDIRQTDDRGRSLPFETRHPNRWNPGNDGTAYEPCTALTDTGLEDLGIEPRTVRDAAGTNGQTLRGCVWEYRDTSAGHRLTVSQIVGNWDSLELEKRMKSTPNDVWRDDVTVDGRTVGLLTDPVLGDCTTYVQSGRAAVNTSVFDHGDALDMDATCDRALEFTRATIGQMPE